MSLAEADRLRAAGIQVSGLNQSGRTRPDGFRLDWETAQVGTEGNGVFFPFLIQDCDAAREAGVSERKAEQSADTRGVGGGDRG